MGPCTWMLCSETTVLPGLLSGSLYLNPVLVFRTYNVAQPFEPVPVLECCPCIMLPDLSNGSLYLNPVLVFRTYNVTWPFERVPVLEYCPCVQNQPRQKGRKAPPSKAANPAWRWWCFHGTNWPSSSSCCWCGCCAATCWWRPWRASCRGSWERSTCPQAPSTSRRSTKDPRPARPSSSSSRQVCV